VKIFTSNHQNRGLPSAYPSGNYFCDAADNYSAVFN